MRDPHKPRDVAWDDFDGDPFDVVDDPSVRVVVECIGGLGLARELVLRAIARGKDVVTANKDLIATEGPWLAAFAARTGATLRYEAAVGGAIPIVRALARRARRTKTCSRSAACSTARRTSCSTRWTRGADYADALAEAQRLGFAEADPRSDVDGHDAAHKLAILAGLAFRRPAVSPALARRGIGAISRDDVRAGAERGCGSSSSRARGASATAIEAGVTPAYVPHDHPFARAARRGERRARRRPRLRSADVLRFGAGGDATASAVVADVLAALEARERVPRTTATISCRGRCARRCWCGSRRAAS